MGTGQRSVALRRAFYCQGVVVLALSACNGGADSYAIDANRSDARDPRAPCSELTAVLGRCEVQGNGADCTGIPGEERTFVPLADGAELRAILGPQGALMFVLALRTSSIFPGDPLDPASAENPIVEIFLDDGSSELAHYRGRPPFMATGAIPTDVETAGLFVVLERPDSGLGGLDIHAQATITDKDGEFRCAELNFVARE